MKQEKNKKNNIPKHRQVISRMVTKFPKVLESDRVESVIKMLTEKSKDFETINYIYVVDGEDILIGVVSIKELFSLPKNQLIGEIMNKSTLFVHPNSHQEMAAMLAIKYNIKSVPVVDKEKKLLGVVPSDVILNILHEEHIEDALMAGGFTGVKGIAKDLITVSNRIYFKKRLPWLIFGLAGGLLAAFIVGFFEDTLEELLALAAFVPAIVYMADAVGVQTQTIFIRSLAIEPSFDFKKYAIREILVGISLSAVLGIIISIISFIWWEPAILGVILGFSFFITIILAVLIALFLPWLFLKLKIDPAIASGPFATIIRDLASVFIYLSTATIILGL